MFPDVVVLGKLKQDLQSLLDRIVHEQPDLVLGVALSTDDASYFEMLAGNTFHGKNILQSGPEMLSLSVLSSPAFLHRSSPTQSFCNYAAYWLSSAMKRQDLSVPIAFAHVTKERLDDLAVLQF